jgi:hypothetical protein
MKVPYMDLTGQVKFGDEKQVTPTEFHGYFSPKQEETDVSGNGSDISDNHDTDSTLEAEQTADFLELHQRGETIALWRDLMAALNRRKIPAHIWTDEIENRLATYEFWREV